MFAVAVCAFAAAGQNLQADTLEVDISGFENIGLEGDPLNTILEVNLGPGTNFTVTGIGWDVTLQTVGDSWLSDAAIGLQDADGVNALIVTPGFADDGSNDVGGVFFPGPTAYSSGGILNFTDAGLDDIVLGANNIFNLEFFDTFADNPGTVDSFYAAGSVLTIEFTSGTLGDANGDGVLTNLDITSFVLALTNPVAYQAMFPDVDPELVLDMNGDKVFNNSDIAGFVAALTGGGTK